MGRDRAAVECAGVAGAELEGAIARDQIVGVSRLPWQIMERLRGEQKKYWVPLAQRQELLEAPIISGSPAHDSFAR